MDIGTAQILDDAADRLVVRFGEELTAQDDALLARRADIADQSVPVGHLRARLAAQRRLASDREDGPERLPAPARGDHAPPRQSLPGQVECALDSGAARLVRSDVQQSGARPHSHLLIRNHNSPGLLAAPRWKV